MCNLVDEPEIFDARSIKPAELYAKTRKIFDELEIGESFILIDDRDPEALRSRLVEELRGGLSWNCRERDGSRWRVEITKAERAA